MVLVFFASGFARVPIHVLFVKHIKVFAGVFLFAGLFRKVLARVFDRAVKYKQENDLTI